jgi:hypothetical protein
MAKGEKHSLVQCRIEANQKVDQIVADKECSIREAMRELATSQGVPFDTLRHWYYKDSESKTDGVKVHPTQLPKSTAKDKAKVAAKIVKNINKALDQDEEDAMTTSHGQAARELADDLGGIVLADELYELFLAKILGVDDVIKANKELAEPMNSEKVIDQLLRLARNAGWTEPVVEEIESSTCDKCRVSSCPNRMCKNHKPKEEVS